MHQTTFAELIEEGALEIGDGYRAKNEELGGDGLIFLRAGHVTDTHIDFSGVDRFRAEFESRVRSKLSMPGDAVITTKGNSTGRTTYVTPSMPPFVYSPHLSYWRSRNPERIEGGFLRYWSKSPEFSAQLAGMKASTDMAPYLSLVDQRRLQISLPSIDDQRAIARTLSSLDDKIDLNRRIAETLESIARALFKSWFVDFDPVRAKAEGRETGLPWEIAELFPDRLVESEIGQLPEGWCISLVGEVLELAYGKALPADVRSPGGVPVYGSGGIAGYHNLPLVPGPAVIIGRKGTVGSLYWEDLASYPIDTVFYVREPKAPLTFCFFALERLGLENMNTDAAVPGLNRTNVYRLEMVLPSDALFARFDRLCSGLRGRMRLCREEGATLASLRDALLPKLISGEFRLTG